MSRSSTELRRDALAIWQAAVNAVDSKRLVLEQMGVDGETLVIGEQSIPFDSICRIVVVGTGKAGAGMAEAVELALGPRRMANKNLTGWVNVPADCVQPLSRITLHAARPAGVNEPTSAGVEGGLKILELIESLTADDLCLCLISGGGSALLPAPVPGISLTDKQDITRGLSDAGANIQELNTVRKQLSRIKGGGLGRACRARLITLIISDVIGDPLDVIASGPTVPDSAGPLDALRVLNKFGGRAAGFPPAAFDYLERRGQLSPGQTAETALGQVLNLVIGNNALAVDAAGMEAEKRGYSHAMVAATELEGQAEDVGRHLAEMAFRMRRESGPDCLITGGEPVVQLVPTEQRGLGGRNQQLVLAALVQLMNRTLQDATTANPLDGIALLSGGTDGEDGPTDAAGAVIDADTWVAMREQSLSPQEFLRRNDAYHFFNPLAALIQTGPTHTNVCDVRVLVTA